MKHYDVVISGAGPVGLFLACELALRKCSVLVLEKSAELHAPVKGLPYGIRGLSSLSIESLNRRGLLDDLDIHKRMKSPHMNAEEGPRRQVGHFAGIPFREGDVDRSQFAWRLPSSLPTALISEIDELETIFARRAVSMGVVIECGVSVTGFRDSGSSVVVFEGGSGPVECSWLVGCDGARSVVRKLGGFEFAGTEPKFTGYTTRIELDDASMLLPGRNVTERGMYMQSQPGFVIMQDFDGGAFHASGEEITAEHVQSVLRRVSGTQVSVQRLVFATAWTDRARQATDYRRGRVLLAGDAAHIHSPLGGQGLNLGLGDAMNLGWKLASVVRGGPVSMLDSYGRERIPVGSDVLDWSRAQVAVMDPGPEGRALHSVMRDVLATRDGATYFASRVWGLRTRYDLGSSDEIVGRTAPNFAFASAREDEGDVDTLMRDGLGLLVDLTGGSVSKELSAVVVEFRGVRFVSARAEETLGLRSVLIRPDGIVAWAATANECDVESLQEALGRWFVRAG